MKKEVQDLCLFLIDAYILEEYKHLYFYSNSLNFIKNKKLINEEFFRKKLKVSSIFLDSFQIDPATLYSKFSEDFIIYFEKDLDWNWISGNSKLSLEFIKNNLDKLCILNILYSQNINEDFLDNISYILKNDKNRSSLWINLFYNSKINLSKDFLKKNIENIPKEILGDSYIRKKFKELC